MSQGVPKKTNKKIESRVSRMVVRSGIDDLFRTVSRCPTFAHLFGISMDLKELTQSQKSTRRSRHGTCHTDAFASWHPGACRVLNPQRFRSHGGSAVVTIGFNTIWLSNLENLMPISAIYLPFGDGFIPPIYIHLCVCWALSLPHE